LLLENETATQDKQFSSSQTKPKNVVVVAAFVCANVCSLFKYTYIHTYIHIYILIIFEALDASCPKAIEVGIDRHGILWQSVEVPRNRRINIISCATN
jgi:hypothetical protein